MKNRTCGELKRLAREFLTGNYTTLICTVLIAAFLPAAMLSPFSAGLYDGLYFTTAACGAAVIIIKLIGQLFIAGTVRIHLMLARKQQIIFTDIFWSFRNHPDRFILAELLLFFLMLLPLAPAAVYIFYIAETRQKIKSVFHLLVLCCIIFCLCAVELYLLYTYRLIYPLFIEHPEMTVRTGFRTSRFMMRGKKKKLFLLQLSFLGWLLLGLCSFGIGLLWICPYIKQTSVNFYLDITGAFDKSPEHIDVTITD